MSQISIGGLTMVLLGILVGRILRANVNPGCRIVIFNSSCISMHIDRSIEVTGNMMTTNKFNFNKATLFIHF